MEELRQCLFKSIAWIAVGVLLGFAVGADVVRFIQIPIEQALTEHQRHLSVRKLETEAAKLQEEGYSGEIISVLKQYGFIPEERYLFPGELERILNRQKLLSEAGSGSIPGKSGLDEVDNLLLQKIERRKKMSEVGLVYENVHLSEKPIRVMFFKKIEDLARTRALGVEEAFKIWLYASMAVGLVIALPFVMYHIWSFIAAGLYPHEKQYVYYFIPISVVLFLGGAAFAFFMVFRFFLDFLLFFNAWMNIEPDLRISEWLRWALLFPIGFGVSFQLPLVMFVLERVGIFTRKQYVRRWRLAVFVIFIIALILTPGDPGSMLLMAVPLTVLYFAGLFFCWLIPRKRGLLDFDDEIPDQA